jgi:hypothetical protein
MLVPPPEGGPPPLQDQLEDVVVRAHLGEPEIIRPIPPDQKATVILRVILPQAYLSASGHIQRR